VILIAWRVDIWTKTNTR